MAESLTDIKHSHQKSFFSLFSKSYHGVNRLSKFITKFTHCNMFRSISLFIFYFYFFFSKDKRNYFICIPRYKKLTQLYYIGSSSSCHVIKRHCSLFILFYNLHLLTCYIIYLYIYHPLYNYSPFFICSNMPAGIIFLLFFILCIFRLIIITLYIHTCAYIRCIKKKRTRKNSSLIILTTYQQIIIGKKRKINNCMYLFLN